MYCQQPVNTPFGDWWACWLEADSQPLLALLPAMEYHAWRQRHPRIQTQEGHHQRLNLALIRYFSSKDSAALEQLSIAPLGTAFQLQVWQAMTTLRFGQQASYQQLAVKINHPKAVRALGSACGANPILLRIPCHRVLAKAKQNRLNFRSDPRIKAWLLAHEGLSSDLIPLG